MSNFYVLLLLLTSLLWGGNFVVGKSLVDHASPLTLTSLRWIIAIAVLLPMVWWKDKKIIPSSYAVLPLILMGISGVALFNLLQFSALEQTTSTNVGLISALNTISISIFSYLFLKEKINILQVLSMIISLLGVLIVLSKGKIHLLFTVDYNIGDLQMVLAVGVWGLYSVCSLWAMKTTSPLMCTLYSGLFGLLILLPMNIFDFHIYNINYSFILSILYTGVISTVVCLVLWNIGIQKLGNTAAGIYLNFNPIFTAILAFLFLGEQLTWIQGIGGLIVIIGCYLFTYFKKLKVISTDNVSVTNLRDSS